MNTEPNQPITDLELLVSDTNALAVAEKERKELVATLQPIANRIAGYVQFADNIKVTNQAEAEQAASVRDSILASNAIAEKALREFDEGLIDRLFRTHRRWTALLGLFTNPLNDAAKRVKHAIIGWQQAEAEKAEKERQRLQAEIDEKARRERERLEKEAAKLKTPEKREERLAQATAVVPSVVQVSVPKPAVKAQKRWKVKSFDMTAMGIPKEIQGFVDVKVQNLERAKAANTMLTVSGVEFHQVLV